MDFDGIETGFSSQDGRLGELIGHPSHVSLVHRLLKQDALEEPEGIEARRRSTGIASLRFQHGE
ncbi:hypothetical protein D9M70_578120 [compost metagenome]